MKILVIDGQGGGVGRSIVEQLRRNLTDVFILGAGTNALASNAMLKAGADAAATGENAVVFNAAHSDMIIGPMGIISANAMYGEITPAMAAAVSAAQVPVILIPASKCGVYVAGTAGKSLVEYIEDAVQTAYGLYSSKSI